MITATPHARALSTLERFGFTPRVVDPQEPAEVARLIGPCTFILIGADAVGVDSGELVTAFRRMSPYAPILLFDRGHAARAGLLAAMKAGVSEVVDPEDEVRFAEVLTSQLQVAGQHRERVLAIGAHPDDIEVGCAGALLAHRQRGDRVTMLTMSGQGSGIEADGTATNAVMSARSIGAQLLVGPLTAGALGNNIDSIQLVQGVVAALDPTVVYIHSEGDTDSDHRNVHLAAMTAVRGVPQVFGYRSWKAPHAFSPKRFVTIDDVVAHKVEVLRLLGSPHAGPGQDPEIAVTDARQWAQKLAPEAHFVEPFEIIRSSGAPQSLLAAADSGNAMAGS